MKVKYGVYGVLVALVAVLGFNLMLIVPKGNVAVETLMGKVTTEKVWKEGFHIVNPIATYSNIPITDQSLKFQGIANNGLANGQLVIQTADKMTTALNVEILVAIKPEFAPFFYQQATTFTGTTNKYIVPALMESLMTQGSGITTAQALFDEQSKVKMKAGSLADIRNYLGNPKIMGNGANGLTVKDFKYQRFVLDPTISDMIRQTKEREELEQVALSQERKRQTDANAALYEKQQQAEATKAQADAEAHKVTVLAAAHERQSDAKLYAMQKEALGMKEISNQTTPQYIKYMEANATVLAAERYQGGTPETLTIMGGDSSAVPFLNIGKK